MCGRWSEPEEEAGGEVTEEGAAQAAEGMRSLESEMAESCRKRQN